MSRGFPLQRLSRCKSEAQTVQASVPGGSGNTSHHQWRDILLIGPPIPFPARVPRSGALHHHGIASGTPRLVLRDDHSTVRVSKVGDTWHLGYEETKVALKK